MRSPTRKRSPITLAIAAAAFVIVPIIATAQTASYRVLINGAAAGTATAVTNLPTDTAAAVTNPPTDTAATQQDSDATTPSKPVLASGQGSVVVTTADPALIAAIQAWMKADNSGFKDTVQRKTVEIDRLMGMGSTTRFELSDAWPSRIDASSGSSSMITIVYERLVLIP
jgi:hypothetical protein